MHIIISDRAGDVVPVIVQSVVGAAEEVTGDVAKCLLARRNVQNYGTGQEQGVQQRCDFLSVGFNFDGGGVGVSRSVAYV